MMRGNADTIKTAARDRGWPEILANLGGLDPAILDGKHHPCPKCGGKDRFRLIDREAGALYCNGCLKDKTGDGLSALRWVRGWDFPKTLAEVARFLGIQPGVNGRSKADKTIRPKDKDDSGGQEEVDRPADLFEQVGLSTAEKAILPALLKTWAAAKPPIAPDAVAAYGARFVRWPRKGPQFRCIAFTGRDTNGNDEPRGLLLYRVEGVPFPAIGSLGERKTHLVKGSRESWLWPGSYKDLLAAEVFIKCEGATDALESVP